MSAEAVSQAVRELQRVVHPSVIDFWKHYDGAVLDANVFEIGASKSSGVNGLVPVSEIAATIRRIQDWPADHIPFAWAEGGNYVTVDDQGAVYFWDHERPQPLTRIATDIKQFLASIRPFDPVSVQLKPGQVQSVWVHPDLQKLIDRNNPKSGGDDASR